MGPMRNLAQTAQTLVARREDVRVMLVFTAQLIAGFMVLALLLFLGPALVGAVRRGVSGTPDDRWREVPIIGRVTAGLPMYAQTEWEGSTVLDAAVFRGQNLFALRVKGQSMKNIGILDGDLAICEPRQYAQNGEIVVALINNEEATVKRFFLRKKYIELRPENTDYAPLRYGFDEILVQGKVIGEVWATHKAPGLLNHKLLLVAQRDGSLLVALDTLDAHDLSPPRRLEATFPNVVVDGKVGAARNRGQIRPDRFNTLGYDLVGHGENGRRGRPGFGRPHVGAASDVVGNFVGERERYCKN